MAVFPLPTPFLSLAEAYLLESISIDDYRRIALEITPCEIRTHCQNPALSEIIAQTFSFPAAFYRVVRNSRTLAIFWIHQAGKVHVSLPHLSYHSIQIDQAFQHEQAAIYYFIIKSFSQSEIRTFKAYTPGQYNEKVSSWLLLPESGETLLGQFSNSMRRKIRKTSQQIIELKKGDHTKSPEEQENLLQDFHWVYRKRLKQLGSPHLGIHFFRRLLKDYRPGEATVWVLYHLDKPVGAAFNLGFDEFLENGWFATLPTHQHLFPAYSLHWHMIQDAIQSGYRIYSFGRSTRESGVHQFKRQWKTTDVALVWNYSNDLQSSRKSIPDLRTWWKRSPSFITRWLGPPIAARLY